MTYTIDLSGKIAVVTGGSGVLGAAMCRGLASAGATVVVLGTTDEKTAALADEIKAEGGKAVGFACDVVDRASIDAAANRIMNDFGRVDILVNCAGGNNQAAVTSPSKTFFDIPEEAVQGVFDLNYLGTFMPSQIFGKVMVRQNEGVIINISSMSAYQPITRVPAYSSSKAAISNFTQWLAVYFAQEYSPNIRVNAIAPGFFVTNQNRRMLINEATGDLTERGQKIVTHTPMDRFGEPDELIGTLLYLVSDGARFVTGTVIPVDGGFMAYKGV
jgi:NAD(P)-dependent dehydrogenase (short-subunit alcohol dehydrogenase family)